MNNTWLSRLMMAASLVLMFGCTSQTLVYRPPVTDADKVGLGFFSHAQGGGAQRNHAHYDNFTLQHDATITGVTWWGLSDNTRSPGLDNFPFFTIELLAADATGAPGEVVFAETFAMAETKPKPTGRRGSGMGEASTGEEFRHEVRFAEPVKLTGGNLYFLCVKAHRADLNSDNWQWQDGVTGDGVSYSFSYGQAKMIRIEDTDSAMKIRGRK